MSLIAPTYLNTEDMKAGKYLGLTPKPCALLRVVPQDQRVTIYVTDASDTIIDSQKLVTVAGTKVVYKTGSAPTGPDDGTEVFTSTPGQYEQIGYELTGLINGTTYYFAAYTLSDHGMVCLDAATATASPSDAAVLNVYFPPVMNGEPVTLTSEHGTKTAEVSDGVAQFLLYDTGTWTICGVDVEISALAASYSLKVDMFAFHYSENDSNPDSVTYPAGYSNSGYTDTFYVNLTTGVPHYGDWDKTDDTNKWLFPKMCMLKYDGTRDYYLYENDVTKKEDGVTASDVARTAYAGNAMVEWGQDGRKIHWKIVPDSDSKGFTFVVANAKTDSDMEPWNHYNCKGGIAEHFYTPMYFGSSDGTRLRSISGGTNYVNNAATAELALAKANNLTADEIWNTEVYADWLLIGMLSVLISKSMNTQAKFGTGRCKSDNTAAIGQGTMNTAGLFYGKNDQTSGIKMWGSENPTGNLWRRLAGLINDKGIPKIKLTYGKEDGSTVDGYNTTGSGYISHGTIGSGTSGGYISHANITNRGITPNTMSGSETTFYSDGGWFNNNQVNYAIVGGNWNGAGRVGVFYCYLAAAVSIASAHIGAAISCKPLA